MLTDAKARAAKPKDKDYKLAAGEGLYLQVRTNGGKYWKLKFRFGGKERKLVTLRSADESSLSHDWLEKRHVLWLRRCGDHCRNFLTHCRIKA